ncbi:MAG: FAD-dependent oxidoreductase [Pseudomonadota bacterium]
MNPNRHSASALVIGGGVIGLFTAWRLLDAGFAVTVLEQGRIGGSASWAGGGILSPLPPWQAPAPVWALAMESLAVYPAIAADLRDATGIDPEWTPSGMRVLEAPDHQMALQWGEAVGLAVDGDEFTLSLPWVAQICSPRLLRAMQLYLSQRGVQWLENRAIVDFEAHSGRVQSVRAADGMRHAGDAVVLCAGAWTGGLAAALSWPVAVQPVRGQMLRFEAKPGLLEEIVLRGPHYLIPRRDGGILVGSTLEWTGFDTSTTASARTLLFEAACELLPPLRHCPVSHHWAALRPGSDQGIPLIGAAPGFDNLYVNAGHFRNGITLAPASARQVVGLMG